MGIELVVSLIVPVAVAVAFRSTFWLLAATLIAIRPLGLNVFVLHFVLGIILAKHRAEIVQIVAPRRAVKALLCLVGLTLYSSREMFAVGTGPDGKPVTWMWVVTGVGSVLLLIVVLSSTSLQRMLLRRWIKHVGKTSYSTYLLHMAVLFCLTPMLLHWIAFNHRHIAWTIGLVATVGATLVLAEPMYWLIEVPSIRLGKTLSRWLASAGRRSRAAKPERLAEAAGLSADASLATEAAL